MKLPFLAAMTAVAVFSLGAQASPIFSDNFDAEGTPEQSVLNYTGFGQWTVSEGTVDLIYNTNRWGIDCAGGSGKCVDLDGSTRSAGTLTSNSFSLPVGTYALTFDVSGNQRGGSDDTVNLTLGGYLSDAITLSAADSWQTMTRNFTVSAQSTDYIRFNHDGGDNIGIMLDNVYLTSVPEPGILILFGLGLAGLGAARRRTRS